MFKEFRDFAMRGNVLDMAVGVIIGAAFGKIVNSMVADILMPPIGMIMGQVDFSSLFVDLTRSGHASLAAAKAAGAPTINYGVFINQIIDFTIMAFVVFLLVRQVSKLQKPKVAPGPPELSATEKLLVEIRDVLKARV